MLTEMRLIPHRHFGLPGHDIQKHLLVNTAAIATLLSVFFDLSRIASLGAIFYLVMDIAIHWDALRHLRPDVEARAGVLIAAIALDALVLIAFLLVKLRTDPAIIVIAVGAIASIFVLENITSPARPARRRWRSSSPDAATARRRPYGSGPSPTSSAEHMHVK